ncbi:hypothetical protein N2152v2_003863 [Parachlorella kessleri]
MSSTSKQPPLQERPANLHQRVTSSPDDEEFDPLVETLGDCKRLYAKLERNQILQDIRSEFRANRDLQDPSKVMQAVEVAQRSLEQLQAYTGLDRGSHDWQVSLKGACD